MRSMNFHGVKIALLYEEKLIVFLRDDKPGLFNANLWDFPGGGREDDETPHECIIREVQEEFGITIKAESIIWEKTYEAQKDKTTIGYFMVAHISKELFDAIEFGEEGQRWQLMSQQEFLALPNAVPAMQARFQDYLHKEKR